MYRGMLDFTKYTRGIQYVLEAGQKSKGFIFACIIITFLKISASWLCKLQETFKNG